MFIISILSFLLLIAGIFFLVNLSPDLMAADLDKLMSPEYDIDKKAKKIQKNKKDGFFVNVLKDTKRTLGFMGMSNKFMFICIASIFLATLGIALSVAMGNAFLIPALFVAFISLPFIFVRIYSYSYTKRLQNELELSLAQVTTSYLRTGDIIKAMTENIENINQPVRKVFEEFISQIKYLNLNTRQAIDIMEEKIDDDIFKEWCESLKKCNQNHTLKYLLQPVVTKYSTLREITGSIENEMSTAKLNFFIICGIVYSNYGIVYVMEKEWFKILTSTTQGLATTGLLMLITVICCIILTYLTKPIKYKV